jgi:hypothetical protein
MIVMRRATARGPRGPAFDEPRLERPHRQHGFDQDRRAPTRSRRSSGRRAAALTINVTQTAGPPPVVTVQVSGNIPFILHWAGFTNFTINRSVTFRDEGRP